VTTVAIPIPTRRPLTARWLQPSLSDVVFGALLLWLLLFTIHSDGTLGLLQDSNTGYHIRTGDFILQHKALPRGDIFSFTKPGQPWFAWEWLCAVLFSLAYSIAGMKALVIFTGTIPNWRVLEEDGQAVLFQRTK